MRAFRLNKAVTHKRLPRLSIVRHGDSFQNAGLKLLGMNPDVEQMSCEEKLMFYDIFLNEKVTQNSRLNRDVIKEYTTVPDRDIPLTDFGRWQGTKTGEYFNYLGSFDICFCPPSLRALQTEAYIESQLFDTLEVIMDDRLRERDFGIFHGLIDDDIKERNLIEYNRWNAEGMYRYRPPNGESYTDVRMRIQDFLKDMEKDWNGKNVLIITHQVPYKMFRAVIECLDEAAVLKLPSTPNCGIQEYLIRGNKLELSKYDRIAYKPREYEPYEDFE